MKFKTNIADILDDVNVSDQTISVCVELYGTDNTEDIVKNVRNFFVECYKEAVEAGGLFTIKYREPDETNFNILNEHGEVVTDYLFDIVGYIGNTFFINGGHTLEVI